MERILFVDDEQNILDGYRRTLRKDFQIETAAGGAEGLEAFKKGGAFAVVVSDMRMPNMDGATFLSHVKELSKDTVRVMLTGNSDQQTAINAVNEGNIFRFLNKPCSAEVMSKTLTQAVEQYRLIRAEKDLIEKTLRGSVQMLTDVLSLVNPLAFGRATRVRHLVRQLTTTLNVESAWQVELAAMLSQIGCITIPEDILQRIYGGNELSPDELRMLQMHPQVGHDLITQIPRLEHVAEIVMYQDKRFHGGGFPHGAHTGEQIPLGARILKVALDFDKLIEAKIGYFEACQEIERRAEWYDPQIVAALRAAVEPEVIAETT